MKNKINILLIIIILLGIIIFFYFLIKNYKDQSDELYSKCYNLEKGFGGPIDITMIDCIGYLRIERSKLCGTHEQPQRCENKHIYDAFNHLSFIKNAEKYLINEKFLYVIGELWYTNFNNQNEKNEYIIRVPINGNYKVIKYQNEESIPKYFMVNPETGDMTLYNTYDQMPEEVKTIFKELE